MSGPDEGLAAVGKTVVSKLPLAEAPLLRAPPRAPRFVAYTPFDGREYGPEYLTVEVGDTMERFQHSEENGWIRVRLWSPEGSRERSSEGWVPQWFLKVEVTVAAQLESDSVLSYAV